MATTLTPNLKLKISSDLTPESKYNLNRIDTLAGTVATVTTGDTVLRSNSNIRIEPASADIGGTGVGGTISLGSADQPLDNLNIFATSINLSSSIALPDVATGGDKTLTLAYKSDLVDAVDTVANRTIQIDPVDADRNLILGGNLSILTGNLELLLTGDTSVTLPTNGTLATLAGVESLTNKTINAATNTIIGLLNANIAAGAAIDGTKILSAFGAQPVETSDRIRFTNGSYTTSLLQAASGQTANLTWRLPSADGTSGQVLTTDGAGILGWSDSAAGSLSGLSDVDIGTPSDGDFLRYNSGLGKWINQAGGGGGAASFVGTWSNGDGAIKVLTHNLGSQNVLVQVYDENKLLIDISSIEQTSIDDVTLTSSSAPDSSWTVLIIALI